MRVVLPGVLLLLASACSSPQSTDSRVDFSGLADGWNEIMPGGDTACASGEPFAFNFRPGSADDFTVFLPGGGACSSFESCDPEQGLFAPGMGGKNHVENQTEGIFDFSNPRNPIAGHSVLFVPYCTGDVFLGDEYVTYEDEAGETREVPHVGYVNTMAALEWVYERIYSPKRVAVLGSSAGAIASPFYAGLLAEHFPDAEINQLGDGAGAYQGPGVVASLRNWQGDSLFEDVDWLQPYVTDSTEFTSLYDAVAQSFDNVRLHQYNTESDSTQVLFVRVGAGAEPDLPLLIQYNLERIARHNPNFRSYTMTGSLHVILARNELYQDALYPTPLRDWIASIIHGESVESITVDRE